jgi:hypothetical protein
MYLISFVCLLNLFYLLKYYTTWETFFLERQPQQQAQTKTWQWQIRLRV